VRVRPRPRIFLQKVGDGGGEVSQSSPEAKETQNLQIHLVKVIAKPYYADARACSDPPSTQFIR
jgi:hypothetical protein